MPNLYLFIIASLILVLTPGPAVLYIVSRSIAQGAKAGIVSSLGLCVGAMAHIAGAALGFSALLLSSALAFNVVKYLGAAYLIYLGIRTLRENKGMTAKETKPYSMGKTFYEGIIVNLLNPKAALFFFAFLPQFVNPGQGTVLHQILLLGLIFLIIAFISDSLYAIFSGSLASWFKKNEKINTRTPST